MRMALCLATHSMSLMMRGIISCTVVPLVPLAGNSSLENASQG
jgi:hypothetical protein